MLPKRGILGHSHTPEIFHIPNCTRLAETQRYIETAKDTDTDTDDNEWAKPSEKPTEISYNLWKSLQMHLRFGIYELAGFGRFKGSPSADPTLFCEREKIQKLYVRKSPRVSSGISQHRWRGSGRNYMAIVASGCHVQRQKAKCMQMNGKTASKQNRRHAEMTPSPKMKKIKYFKKTKAHA